MKLGKKEGMNEARKTGKEEERRMKNGRTEENWKDGIQ